MMKSNFIKDRSMVIGLIIGFIGSTLRFFAILGGKNGTFEVFYVGQAIIGLSTLILMITALFSTF